ncbi:MAG TPA: hypothetical protein VJ553_03710 [Candidatus Paceibacterota bacterium]|nr:hypothetical protein [Candidatus Paceibacterota bacterium]
MTVITSDSSHVYVGGNFNYVGRGAEHGIPVNTATGLPLSVTTRFDNEVTSVVADGSDGWFVGGYFNTVNGETRNYLAHIMADGTLDPDFDPDLDFPVYVLASASGVLYVGGEFTAVNVGTTNTPRNYLAAFDSTTGEVQDFNPDLNGFVHALVLDGTTLYVGGNFTAVNVVEDNEDRNRIAAFDTTIAADNATAFDPNVDNIVTTLVLNSDGSVLYAGGAFWNVNQAVDNELRNNIAAFDTTIAADNATAFDPDVDDSVHTLLLDGTTLYAGGDFQNVNVTLPATSKPRGLIAAFDTGIETDNATDFNPNIAGNGGVYSLVLDGSVLYAGGSFTTVNDTPQQRLMLAAFDTTTDTDNVTDFDPSFDPQINALALSGTTLFVGGSFTHVDAKVRDYLFAIDTETDTIADFDPDLDGTVYSLALDGTTLYAGGDFQNVNVVAHNEPRNRIAAFDTEAVDPEVNVTAFNPDVNAVVYTLLLDGTTLYAGGDFTAVNVAEDNEDRNRIAAFDTTIAADNATAFNPDVNAVVYTLLLDGTTLYAGGDFTAVNVDADIQLRNHLASFDTLTDDDNVTDFDPNIGDTVDSLALSSDQSVLYVGGQFEVVDDASLLYLATFETEPTPTPTPATGGGSSCFGTLTATVTISGGSATAADATLYLNNAGMDRDYAYAVTCITHQLSASPITGYAQSWSGDCAVDGTVTVVGSSRSCTAVYTYSAALGASPTPTPTPGTSGAASPAQYNLQEGDTISAPGSNDPDVYIINEHGYKRLFLNPIIFSFYGHLGSFANVKSVSPDVRDAFLTSGLFRNCETDDSRVYAVEVTGEDTGILHHVALSGADAVSQDTAFFRKVFCINSNEEAWYPVSPAPYTSLIQVPVYVRE